MPPEKRVLLAIKSAQNILARHVEPGGLDEKGTIDALLAVLDDEHVVQAVEDFKVGPTEERLATILQDLYDSEINYVISTFWDAGFRVMLGDDLDGFIAETRVATFREAVQWPALTAIKHHPDTDFATKYRP